MKRIVIDVLVFLAVASSGVLALFALQAGVGVVDRWVDGLTNRVVVTDCDPKGCWPH